MSSQEEPKGLGQWKEICCKSKLMLTGAGGGGRGWGWLCSCDMEHLDAPTTGQRLTFRDMRYLCIKEKTELKRDLTLVAELEPTQDRRWTLNERNAGSSPN